MRQRPPIERPADSRLFTDRALADLRAGRWSPGAWTRFLGRCGMRSWEQVRLHPRAAIEISALHLALLPIARRSPLTLIGSWLMAVTHLGLLGPGKASIGVANSLSLVRANLPISAGAPVLAIASDVADGWLARRGRVTAFGGYADTLADVTFWTRFAARRGSRLLGALALAVKMRPIVDLYLNPPADGPVWCFDEMTCIQALERCFPELPLRRPGELAKRSFEYIRHGTRCLLASLEVHTGRILGRLYPRRRREEFIDFLNQLDCEVPAAQVIHLVLDNLNIHRGPHVDEWLARHPGRVRFHFLPFHASWLNQIELWFNTLQRRCLRRGDFPSVDALEKAITDFIRTYNRLHAHPYRWTWTGDPLVA